MVIKNAHTLSFINMNVNWRSLRRKLFTSAPLEKPPEKGEAVLTGVVEAGGGGTFITAAALVTFPVATATIGLISKFVEFCANKGFKSDAWTKDNMWWITIIIALVIGIFIFVFTTLEESARPKDKRQWFIAIVIGTVNTIYLAGAALGIPEIFTKSGNTAPNEAVPAITRPATTP
jgi:hypothetical protein